jgi:hypothetical protein
MSSRPLQHRKPQFKETTQEPACQRYHGVWQSDDMEDRRKLVVPAPVIILNAVTFLGTGDRFGQA